MIKDDDSAIAPSWGRRLTGVEGLRALAAISVAIGHVRIHLAADTKLGVLTKPMALLDNGLTLFFVLSGFLLYRPFAAAILSGRPRPSIPRFLRNRALRIFPAYVAIFLLASYVLRTTYTTAVTDGSGAQGVRATLGPVMSPTTALADLSMFQTLLPATIKTGLGVAWSLTTEATFYLALPLVVLAGIALNRRLSRPLAAALVVPAGLLLTGWIGKSIAALTLHYSTAEEKFSQLWGAHWHAVLERSLLVQADLFGWGALAAVIYCAIDRYRLSSRTNDAVRIAGAVVVLAVVLLLLGPGLPHRLRGERVEPTFMAATVAALLLIVLIPNRRGAPPLLAKALDFFPVRYIGQVSYSFYLWHLPVLWWLYTHHATLQGQSKLALAGNAVLVIGVSLALSAATYHLVEKPALRWKKRTDTSAMVRSHAHRADGASPQQPSVLLRGDGHEVTVVG